MDVRPTAATVDLGAVRENLRAARSQGPGQPVCGVVKANAYGHGALHVARALEAEQIDWLAVALVEEAVALREGGIKTPLLVLASAFAGGYDAIVEHGLTPVLYRADHVEALGKAARGRPMRLHLKVDTGMGRVGLGLEEVEAFLTSLAAYPNLVLDGVMSHFANADLADRSFNAEQVRRFAAVVERLAARGATPTYVHLANSAAVLSYPDARRGMLRPGLLLYGINPLPEPAPVPLRPVLRWTTRPVHVKEVAAGTRVSYGGRWVAPRPSRIATLPVGYADGYPRAMTGKAHVLVRGVRVPIVGTICMDLCMADVTDVPGVGYEDEVVLLGRQGEAELTAHDLAHWAGTITYEIVCGIGARVPRRYVGT